MDKEDFYYFFIASNWKNFYLCNNFTDIKRSFFIMIDLSIIIAYLLITIVVGFVKGRNVTTMKDFSVASYNYSTPVIVATISATLIGGETIFGITEKVYDEGLIYILACMALPLSTALLAFVLAPRFGRFHGMISVGDVMGSFYGKPGKVITGIAGVLLSVGYVGAQVSAIGYFCNYFLDIPYIVGILLGSGVVIAYSTLGGIRAVTATDVIQFGVLIIAIPMICNIGLNIVGGYNALLEALPQKHLSLSPRDINYFHYGGLFILFSIPFLDPAITQRILMTKDIRQASMVMKITALIELPFTVTVCVIALVAFSINPDLDSHLVAPYLINTILPEGIKGLCLAGMLAIIMSTADSYLNAASITIIHDVIKPLRKKAISDRQELNLTRISTFALGIFAIVAAVSFEGIMDIVISFCNFWGPVVLIPLVSGLFGYKASKTAFVAAAVAGVSTFLIWVFWCEGHLGVDSFMPSIAANAAIFFGLNEYLKRKGSLKNEMTGKPSSPKAKAGKVKKPRVEEAVR